MFPVVVFIPEKGVYELHPDSAKSTDALLASSNVVRTKVVCTLVHLKYYNSHMNLH